jgi:Copper type II ascorbate-dependent monooxygenase, C-terminal domain
MKIFIASLCIVAILCIAILFPACKKSSNNTNDNAVVAKDTWTIINESILTPSCATSGCHSSTTDATYLQHNLVLTASVAYENLVNIASKNSNANTDGLARVKPGDYLKSLLYYKVDCAAGYGITNYGAKMPLGSSYLSLGKIEFIKQWIIKGAPKTGSVVDEGLLKNEAVCVQPFVPLPPPTAAEGFQLKIDPFSVLSNTEREVFLRRNTPNTSTVYVNKYTMRGRPNSHHFVMYGFQNATSLPAADVLRDLYNADGSINVATYLSMQNHVFLGGGTDVNASYTFPTGVALKVPAGTALDLNAHYFNRQATSLTGENFINFYTVPQASVIKEAKTINFPNYNFSIPANTRKTITTNFTFPSTTTVIMLTSHFHKTGEKFQIKIYGGVRNGEVVYENTDWEHPLTLNLTTPIQLNAGEGLTSVVTYNNTTNHVINFGLTSEDEMNIIFGYYY